MKKIKELNKTKKLIINICIVLFFEIFMCILTPIISIYIKPITLLLILLVLIISTIKNKQKKLNSTNITNIIIIIGILLRTMYIIYTPITVRQHDVDYFNYEGHLSYINTIYKTSKLPSTNSGQYYHPPLHHIISATFLHANDLLLNLPFEEAVEGLQIITLLFSSLTLFIISQILSRIKIKDKYKHLVNIFFAINPTMIILSGSINNDCLEYFFQFTILLYLLKYYEKPSIKNSLILGILTGLCMLTKFNGIIMLGPITLLFLYKLYKEKNIKETGINYSIVLLISLVLGLSYQIRNYILFGLNSVPYPSDYLSVEEFTIFERMIIPSITSVFDKIFCNIPGDYNIFAYIVKCSIFGEYTYNISNVFYCLFVIINLYLIIFSTILLIKNIKNIFKDKINLILMSNYIIIMSAFYYFNYKYPYICTMDFRYIVPTLLTGIVVLVTASNEDNKLTKYLIDIPLILFIILSIIFLFII